VCHSNFHVFCHRQPNFFRAIYSWYAEASDLFVCDVIVAEALSGGDTLQRTVIESMIRALEYVSTAPADAVWAAHSRRLRRAHGPRSLADAIIAGVAWHQNAIVVTRNPRDFEVQGVRVLGYA
jgi:predicted nucleic acid-binding protein